MNASVIVLRSKALGRKAARELSLPGLPINKLVAQVAIHKISKQLEKNMAPNNLYLHTQLYPCGQLYLLVFFWLE